MTSSPSDKARLAEGMAAKGQFVFPVKAGAKVPHPMLGKGGGFLHASDDPEKVAGWWRVDPEANIGWVPGRSGLLALDLDNKGGANGVEGLSRLLERWELPRFETAAARTPSGGTHLLLSIPEGKGPYGNFDGKLAPGIDVRSSRGYILAAGSATGKGSYGWLPGKSPKEAGFQPMPAPLSAALDALRERAQRQLAKAPDLPLSGRGRGANPEAILEKYIALAVHGERNTRGLELACQLRDNGLSESEAESWMAEYQRGVGGSGRDAYTWKEASASLAQAFRRAPREPWPEKKPDLWWREPGAIEKALPPRPSPPPPSERGEEEGEPEVEAPARAPEPVQLDESPELEDALAADLEAQGWGEPMELRRAAPPEPPTDLLPWTVRDMVASVAASLQVDEGMAAAAAFGAFSAALSNKVWANLHPDWREPALLWILNIQRPSELKSPTQGALMGPLMERDAAFARERKRAKREQEVIARRAASIQKELEDKYDKAIRAGRLEEAESILQTIGAMADEEEAGPRAPKLFIQDATEEALSRTMGDNHGRIAIIDEEGKPLRNAAGNYSNGSASVETLNKGYDGKSPIVVTRMSRDEVRIDRAALSIFLSVQPGRMAPHAKNPELRDSGFIARFLFVEAASMAGYRETSLSAVPEIQASTKRAYAALLNEAIDLPEGQELSLSPGAVEAFERWSAAFEPRLREETGDLAGVADWAGKHRGRIARLAAVIHCMEFLGRDGFTKDACLRSKQIGPAEMEAAIAWGDWFEAHSLSALARFGASERVGDARAVLEWMLEARPRCFSRLDAFRGVRRKIEDHQRVNAALWTLHDYGWIRPVNPGAKGSEVRYETHPAVGASPAGASKAPGGEEALRWARLFEEWAADAPGKELSASEIIQRYREHLPAQVSSANGPRGMAIKLGSLLLEKAGAGLPVPLASGGSAALSARKRHKTNAYSLAPVSSTSPGPDPVSSEDTNKIPGMIPDDTKTQSVTGEGRIESVSLVSSSPPKRDINISSSFYTTYKEEVVSTRDTGAGIPGTDTEDTTDTDPPPSTRAESTNRGRPVSSPPPPGIIAEDTAAAPEGELPPLAPEAQAEIDAAVAEFEALQSRPLPFAGAEGEAELARLIEDKVREWPPEKAKKFRLAIPAIQKERGIGRERARIRAYERFAPVPDARAAFAEENATGGPR